MLTLIERNEITDAVRKALDDVDAGWTSPAEDVFTEFEKENRIQN